MQDLTQPKIVRTSLLAGLITAIACFPRLALVPQKTHPLWFGTFLLFFCSTTLWGFVFAWHTKYSGWKVFRSRISSKDGLIAFGLGCIFTLLAWQAFDPFFRLQTPQNYPTTFSVWVAMSLFDLSLHPLFFILAPLAFFLRLFHSRHVAVVLTVSFSIILVSFKAYSGYISLPWHLAALFLIFRTISSFLSIYFYTRGGLLLLACWVVPLQIRSLLVLYQH